jgi:hypothetical protein
MTSGTLVVKLVGFCVLCWIIACVNLCRAAEFRKIRLEKVSRARAETVFQGVRIGYVELEDGTVVKRGKLVSFAGEQTNSVVNKAEGEWKWEIDEESLARRGLIHVRTIIVQNTGGGNYAVQHLEAALNVPHTKPNYILVVPWDHSLPAGAKVEGLAKSCGMRDYPIGGGVVKPKQAYELITVKPLDWKTFVESLKKGDAYDCILPVEKKCPVCGGKGRMLNPSFIGKNKRETVPCTNCAGTGMVKVQTPFIVAW